MSLSRGMHLFVMDVNDGNNLLLKFTNANDGLLPR